MLITFETMRGVVQVVKDWHPSRVSKAYTGQKYKRHTRGGLMYQSIILNDKMRSFEERVAKRIKELEHGRG